MLFGCSYNITAFLQESTGVSPSFFTLNYIYLTWNNTKNVRSNKSTVGWSRTFGRTAVCFLLPLALAACLQLWRPTLHTVTVTHINCDLSSPTTHSHHDRFITAPLKKPTDEWLFHQLARQRVLIACCCIVSIKFDQSVRGDLWWSALKLSAAVILLPLQRSSCSWKPSSSETLRGNVPCCGLAVI